MQIEEFLVLCKKLPLAVYPIINFQARLQAVTFGQSAWIDIATHARAAFQTKTAAQIVESLPDCAISITAKD